MKKERAVEIYLRGEPDSFGTGYLIAPDLVLTARHVLAIDTAKPPRARSCEVRLFGDIDAGREQWRAANLVWPTDLEWAKHGALDIALIAIQPDQWSTTFALDEFKWGTPDDEDDDQEGYRCSALGFPKGRIFDGDKREIWRARGPADPINGSREGIFDVALDRFDGPDATRRQFRDVKDWRGFSGAALFVGNHLVGVVVQAPEFDQSLKARRVERALREASFKELVRPSKTGQGSDRASIAPRVNVRSNWPDEYIHILDRQDHDHLIEEHWAERNTAGIMKPAVVLFHGRHDDEPVTYASRYGKGDLDFNKLTNGLRQEVYSLEWPYARSGLDARQRGMSTLKRQLARMAIRSLTEPSIDPGGVLREGDPVDKFRAYFATNRLPRMLCSFLQASRMKAEDFLVLSDFLDFLSEAATSADVVCLFLGFIYRPDTGEDTSFVNLRCDDAPVSPQAAAQWEQLVECAKRVASKLHLWNAGALTQVDPLDIGLWQERLKRRGVKPPDHIFTRLSKKVDDRISVPLMDIRLLVGDLLKEV